MPEKATFELAESSAEASAEPEENLPVEVNPLDEFFGYEEMDAEDFVIPRVKIVQPSSKKGTAGTFRSNLTEEEFVNVLMVPVKVERGRVMWDPDNPNAEMPLCKSSNFIQPDAEIEDPPCGCCIEYREMKGRRVKVPVCPMAEWSEGEDGRRIKPPCSETISFLCLEAPELSPFWITFVRTGLKAARRLISFFGTKRARMYGYQVLMGLQEESGKLGRYFVPVFGKPERLDPDMLHEVENIVQVIKVATLSSTFDEERDAMAGEAQADDGDSGNEGVEQPEWMKEQQEK